MSLRVVCFEQINTKMWQIARKKILQIWIGWIYCVSKAAWLMILQIFESSKKHSFTLFCQFRKHIRKACASLIYLNKYRISRIYYHCTLCISPKRRRISANCWISRKDASTNWWNTGKSFKLPSDCKTTTENATKLGGQFRSCRSHHWDLFRWKSYRAFKSSVLL